MRPGPRLAMLLLVALCVSNVACWWLKKPARATCPTALPAFLQRNSIMPAISSGIITDSRHGANTRLRSALFLLAMMRSRNSSVPASRMPLPTASAPPCTGSPPPCTGSPPPRIASPPPRTASAPRRTALPPRPAAKKNAAAKPNPAGYRQEQRATREQPKTAENGPPPSLGQMFSQEERAELTQSLDRNLSNAREAMSRLSGHALTAEQFQAVSLVQSLLVQADKARQIDLTVAAQLARRADVLARDLLTSVR